jgi:hypothetical protein
MRAFDGQKTDNKPVQRTDTQKQAQLRELKVRLAGMMLHESPALRGAISTKIRELEAELNGGRGGSPRLHGAKT